MTTFLVPGTVNLVSGMTTYLYVISSPVEYPSPIYASFLQNSANWSGLGTTTNTITLDSKTYKVSVSSFLNASYYPNNIMNKRYTEDWANAGYIPGSNAVLTSGSTGAPSTTVSVSGSPTTYWGHWAQIQLPSAIVLYNYKIACGVGPGYIQAPYIWSVAGSNDGSSWVQVDYQNGITGFTSGATELTFNLGTIPSNPYSYYRIIIRAVSSANNGYVSMSEWRLFGI